jgi:tRNA-2-methylthio-N6-dimethylallyladenosine synthase
VVAEVAALVERGVAEVTLLGQTVNSYRDPSRLLGLAPSADPSDEDESEFAALLRSIADRVPKLRRLRYTSPHPRHLTPSLIRAHAELEVLPRHVHLPVQSGSDRMLKRMIRRYTRDEYLRRIAKLRESVPGLTLSTDIIVGFPGESEADFAETLSLVEEAGFVGVFGFKYSVRPFTPAKKLADDVSEAEKSERLARLFELSEALVARHLSGLVGSTEEVLLEGASKRGLSPEGPAGPNAGASFSGRTGRNEIVHVDDPACEGLVGQVVRVTVKRALKHSLVAELDEAARLRGLEALASRPAKARGRRSLPVVAVGEA